MSNHEQEYTRPSEDDMINVPERPTELIGLHGALAALTAKVEMLEMDVRLLQKKS